MNRKLTGQFETNTLLGESIKAFIPSCLPPEPPLEMTLARQALHDSALLALGRLDAISALLPDPNLYLYSYVRREAVLSSQIEGTQSSLSDLMLFEMDAAPGVPIDDVEEVSNYVAALQHGIARLDESFPLSVRLLREVHARLLSGARGGNKQPGELRTSQNWIGGSRPSQATFVPPPHTEVPRLLSDLEFFLNADTYGGPLIKSALAHVQFETIHPFLDGNGRVGRLLISLVLHAEGVLGNPLLYLSLYFKQNRAEYYRLLNEIRADGDWEQWVDFFLRGIEQTATNAVNTANRLVALFHKDEAKLNSLGAGAANAARVFHLLRQRALTTVVAITREINISKPTATRALGVLQDQGIVREITKGKYNRIYAYDAYLAILNEGAEL